MHTYVLEGADLFLRLQMLEKEISYVRKSNEPTTFLNLIFIEEVSLIRQAKREHHPIIAKFSGKAFINLDDEFLFSALQEKIIDDLIDDTPLLKPFMKEAIETFKFIP
ncbi:MAG: hypothetical protein KFB93_00465 [Simkaniaceae bacterium]|jgi:hypothetical protein|nr:MAG: hypothetical protein KFB93_00465 [Simkaniaceae bacterium]